MLLLVVSCCWLLLSVCLSCDSFYVDVLEWRLLLYWSEDCCSLLDWNWFGWIEIELVDLKLNELGWNWINLKLVDWIVVHRRQNKLCLLGLGSGGFCISISQCDVFVSVVVVIYCVVDDSCQLWIVGCPLSIICWLLLNVCLSYELFYVDVMYWRMLLYWNENWCSLLDWIELVGLKLNWLD